MIFAFLDKFLDLNNRTVALVTCNDHVTFYVLRVYSYP